MLLEKLTSEIVCCFSMREEYGLLQSALKSVMSYTTQICQDSVLLAGQRVKRKLENRVDISDCLDLSDFPHLNAATAIG